MTKQDYIEIKISFKQEKELEKIYTLLTSNDLETIILSFSLFKSLFSEDCYFDAGFIDLIKYSDVTFNRNFCCGKYFVLGGITLLYIILNLLNNKVYYKYKLNEQNN